MIDLSTFIPVPITAAIISAAVSFGVQYYFRQIDKQAQYNSLIKSLHTELITLKKIYTPLRIGPDYESGNTGINIASITLNYTTVYANNADKLGMLDDETAAAVVEAYTRISSLLDTWLCYSKVYEKLVDYEHSAQRSDTFSPELANRYYQDVQRNHAITFEIQENTLQAVDRAMKLLNT